MNTLQAIATVISSLVAAGAGGAGFTAAIRRRGDRRKADEEADSIAVDNAGKVVALQDRSLVRLEQKVDELESRVDQLLTELDHERERRIRAEAQSEAYRSELERLRPTPS